MRIDLIVPLQQTHSLEVIPDHEHPMLNFAKCIRLDTVHLLTFLLVHCDHVVQLHVAIYVCRSIDSVIC